MEANKIAVLLCGIYSFGFAIFHVFFWRIFNWKEDLKKLSIANRAIIQIANLRLIYIFVFVGSSCLLFSEALIRTRFGNFFLAGNSIFWLGRTIEQFIFLRLASWAVHILTILFILGIVLFLLPLIL